MNKTKKKRSQATIIKWTIFYLLMNLSRISIFIMEYTFSSALMERMAQSSPLLKE